MQKTKQLGRAQKSELNNTKSAVDGPWRKPRDKSKPPPKTPEERNRDIERLAKGYRKPNNSAAALRARMLEGIRVG